MRRRPTNRATRKAERRIQGAHLMVGQSYPAKIWPTAIDFGAPNKVDIFIPLRSTRRLKSSAARRARRVPWFNRADLPRPSRSPTQSPNPLIFFARSLGHPYLVQTPYWYL